MAEATGCASMLEVRSYEEFVRALEANEVVMIGYYDPESRDAALFYSVYKKLSEHADPRILVIIINTRRSPELSRDLSTTPCIRVYYHGKVVFEQQGLFGDMELDVYVLRRSIRTVLRELSIPFRI